MRAASVHAQDGTGHAAMISSPNDMQLKDEGFTILGDAATEIGGIKRKG